MRKIFTSFLTIVCAFCFLALMAFASGCNEHVHTPSEWIIDKEATCVEKGKKHKECLDCDEILEEEEIDVISHTQGEWSYNELGHWREFTCGHENLDVGAHSFTNGVCECGFNNLEFAVYNCIAMHEDVSNVNYVLTDEFPDGTSKISYVNGKNILNKEDNIEYYEQVSSSGNYRFAECNGEMVRTQKVYKGYDLLDAAEELYFVIQYSEEAGVQISFNVEKDCYVFTTTEQVIEVYCKDGKLVKLGELGFYETITYGNAPEIQIPTSFIDEENHQCYEYTITTEKHSRTYYHNGGEMTLSSYHDYNYDEGTCYTCGHDSKLLLASILEIATENYVPFGEQSYKIKISQIDYVGPPQYEEITSYIEIVYNKNAISVTQDNGETEYLEKTNDGYYSYTLNGNVYEKSSMTENDVLSTYAIKNSLSELIKNENAQDYSIEYYPHPSFNNADCFRRQTSDTIYNIVLEWETNKGYNNKIRGYVVGDIATKDCVLYEIEYGDFTVNVPNV